MFRILISALPLVLFSSCVTAPGPTLAEEDAALRKITVEKYTAGEQGLFVNSYLIYGSKNALLVDAQLTVSDTRKLVRMIRSARRELATVFITHAHADHFLGLEILTREFPRAKILATPGVVEDMKESGRQQQEHWKRLLRDAVGDRVVIPKAFTAEAFYVDSEKVEVKELPHAGESPHAAILFLNNSASMITGDLVSNAFHYQLSENHPESWIDNLIFASEWKRTATVLPGRGVSAPAAIFVEAQRYLEGYVAATLPPFSVDEARTKMVGYYPKYRLPQFLEDSLKARASSFGGN